MRRISSNGYNISQDMLQRSPDEDQEDPCNFGKLVTRLLYINEDLINHRIYNVTHTHIFTCLFSLFILVNNQHTFLYLERSIKSLYHCNEFTPLIKEQGRDDCFLPGLLCRQSIKD